MRDGLIGTNPASAEFVDGICAEHKEGRTMTPDEARPLLDYVKTHLPVGFGVGYDVYGHLMVEDRQQVADAMGRVLAG